MVQLCKMYGAEPRYNETRYIEILDITSTNQKPKLKIYSDTITNKRHLATEIVSYQFHQLFFLLLTASCGQRYK